MALPGGAYEGASITAIRADKFIPDVWSAEIKRFRDQRLVMARTVKKLPMVGRKGDVVHIPAVSRMAVYDKIAETPVTLQARTETEFTITIDRYKESSFMLEDVVDIQAAYDVRAEYTREAGYALARDIDNAVLALRAVIKNNSGQNLYVTSDGTSGGTKQAISKAAILAAKQVLDEADAPQDSRMLIVSPGQMADMLTITEFVSLDYQSNTPTESGKIGRIYNIDVMMTTQIGTNSATGYVNGTGSITQPTPGVVGSPYLPSQDTYGTGLDTAFASAMLCHPDWAILAMQQDPRIEHSREVLFQADVLVATQIYGTKVYRPDHAVILNTAP